LQVVAEVWIEFAYNARIDVVGGALDQATVVPSKLA
jgi:hypothetical protein